MKAEEAKEIADRYNRLVRTAFQHIKNASAKGNYQIHLSDWDDFLAEILKENGYNVKQTSYEKTGGGWKYEMKISW